MFVGWATRQSETGDSGVAAGFDAVPPLNIPMPVDPTLPLPRARIHQNQILTSDPHLSDSDRCGSNLTFPALSILSGPTSKLTVVFVAQTFFWS